MPVSQEMQYHDTGTDIPKWNAASINVTKCTCVFHLKTEQNAPLYLTKSHCELKMLYVSKCYKNKLFKGADDTVMSPLGHKNTPQWIL